MELRNKNILLISPETWEHIFVSKHHYASHLAARGNNVYFLNPPTKNKQVTPTEFNNVWSINYTGFVKGLRYLPSFLKKWLMLKKLNQLQLLCNVKFDIVWSFDNSVFYDFTALPNEVLKISHIVDLNQNFQTAKAASTADICFAVSHNILNRLEKYQKKSFFINHGYNNCKELKHDISIPGINKTKVALAGNLAMPYLDWEVVLETARSNKNVDFIFYGPYANEFSLKINSHHKIKEELSKLNHTYFAGKVETSIIPAIFKKMDILLISYQEKHHLDQSNPHKMMEYLGSGKAVVVTKTQEYENLANSDLIGMTYKNEDFPLLFKTVLNNLKEWNSEGKMQKRIDFALDNTYDKQIERVEELLTIHS